MKTTEQLLLATKDIWQSGNNRILILSGLKSLDFRPLICFGI